MTDSAMQAAAKAAQSASAGQPFSWENATRRAFLAFLSSEECVEAVTKAIGGAPFPAAQSEKKATAAIAALKQIVERGE